MRGEHATLSDLRRNVGDENDRDVRIKLRIENKVPFEIQTLGIAPITSQEFSGSVTHSFSPGRHELQVEGKVTEYYERQ